MSPEDNQGWCITRQAYLNAIREAEERGAQWALVRLIPENDDHDESCESDWDNQAHCATPCGCRSREAARIVRAAREQEAR